MDKSFNKFYVAFLLETLLLTVVLLWSPSEAGNQFLLGRSLPRWIIVSPAILVLFAGLIPLCIRPWREQLLSIHPLRKFVIAWDGRTGEYLILSGLAVSLFILVFLWSANKTGHQDMLIRFAPWLIFAGLMFLQASYLLIKIEEDRNNLVDFRKSFTRIPSALRYLLLDEKEDKPVISENTSNILYKVAIAGLVFVFLFQGYFFLKFAGLNSDEGWYLYAARQVFHGERLYQDFGFTQMPLLPYIYGIGQLIYPSVYTGRITSLAIFGLGLYFAIAVNNKVFNREASIWILLIAVTYASNFYFTTIVKTYSLTFLFLTLSVYIWLSEFKAEIKYPLLAFVLLLGFFTRLTFIVYTSIMMCIILYEVWHLDNRLKIFLGIFLANVPLLFWGGYSFIQIHSLPYGISIPFMYTHMIYKASQEWLKNSSHIFKIF